MDYKSNLPLLITAFKTNRLKGLLNLGFNYVSMITEPIKVYSKIIHVQLEVTTRCNLSCIMCGRTYWDRECSELSFEKFKLIIDQFPFLCRLLLQGLGEPFMNKDILKMVEYAKSKGIIVSIVSNGTLINEEVARKIVSSGLDHIGISVDCADSNTYEAIRIGADFKDVIKNIKTLVRLRGNLRKPEIELWAVAMKENMEKIPDLCELAHILGVDGVRVQSLNKFIVKRGDNIFLKDENVSYENIKKYHMLFEKKAKEFGISSNFRWFNDANSKKRSCKWPWVATYITTDGDVTPCCLRGQDTNVITFGNMFCENFDTNIWNNSTYQKFRKDLKSNVVPEICIDCPVYYGF